MKNTKTTLFSKMLFLASFVVLSLNISLAQTDQPQLMRVMKNEDNGKGKNATTVLNTNEVNKTGSNGVTNTPPPIVQPNYEEMSKGRVKDAVEDDNTNSQNSTVTYVGDEKKMTVVDYTIDSQKSNFDNLTNMIDARNKVHASDNHATLTQTPTYTQLLSDITAYRAKFDADVNKKGFENC